jgi:hypothetical protein
MSQANLGRCLIALSLLLPIPALAQSAFTTQVGGRHRLVDQPPTALAQRQLLASPYARG